MRRVALIGLLAAGTAGCTQAFVYGRHQGGYGRQAETLGGIEIRWYLWDALSDWHRAKGDK